jgi:TPR repeat protein
MKKFITTVMFILLGCNILHAQTYLYGEEYHKRMMLSNPAYLHGYALSAGIINQAKYNILVGNYSKALDLLEKWTTDYHYGPAFCLLGECYELGIGVDRDLDIADEYYKYGAYNLNDFNCQGTILRIKSIGHLPASYRETFLKEIKNSISNTITIPNGSGGYVGGNPLNNNGSSSSSLYSTCRICGGSGTCTSCHGQGGSW